MDRQRTGYMARCEMARQNPDDYMSLVIDGADQTAYTIPPFAQRSKNLRGEGMKVKLVGVKRHHAPSDSVMCYLMTGGV